MRVLASPSVAAVPFDYLAHLVTVPVTVGGSVESRFVLDSGIGLTLLSASLADAVGCAPTGATFSGRRMSGQEVAVSLAAPVELAFGGLERTDDRIGIFDTSGFPADFAGIGGFLSLAFFDETPFTVDYPNGVVVLETPETLAERASVGRVIDVAVERDGPSVTFHLPLTLPDGQSVDVEVDMGSGGLILDEGLAPELAQTDPDVMFQRIIYDGLVGDDFLRRFAVTWDVGGGRMIFAV